MIEFLEFVRIDKLKLDDEELSFGNSDRERNCCRLARLKYLINELSLICISLVLEERLEWPCNFRLILHCKLEFCDFSLSTLL